MKKIEIDDANHLLNGLWLYEKSYDLASEAFSEQMRNEIREKTGLVEGELPDTWVNYDEPQPERTWRELIEMSIGILSCRATRLFVRGLYIEKIPEFSIKTDIAGSLLPAKTVCGAKRINASCIDWTSGDQNRYFTLTGKDSSCMVEGSWLEWCLFACSVLGSENTKIICPELFAPGLKN